MKTNTLCWSIGSCEQPETFSTSLTMTARYLTPGYFCRSSNEDLDFRVSLLIFQAQVHQRAYTPRRCYSTLMSHTSMHAVIPVSSSGRPLDLIHGTSLRGRHGDEEISPGGIQSLLVLLPSWPPGRCTKDFISEPLSSFSSAAAWGRKLNTSFHKETLSLSFSLVLSLRGFTPDGAIITAGASFEFQRGKTPRL